MKIRVLPIVIGALGTVPKGLVKRMEDLEIRGLGNKSGDHPNYYITEIGQNIQSPGDFRRYSVTETPVKNHHIALSNENNNSENDENDDTEENSKWRLCRKWDETKWPNAAN